jgi:hypothetical protein
MDRDRKRNVDVLHAIIDESTDGGGAVLKCVDR